MSTTEKKATDPFLHYQNIGVDYEADNIGKNLGRMTYMPLNGDGYDQPNTVITYPDEYDEAMINASISAQGAIRSTMNNDSKIAAINNFNDNLAMNMASRYSTSIMENVLIVFNNGLGSLIDQFITDDTKNAISILFKRRLFYPKGTVIFTNYSFSNNPFNDNPHHSDGYIRTAEDYAIKISYTKNDTIAHIADCYSTIISEVLLSDFKLDEFVATLFKYNGINEDSINHDAYFAYVVSALHEQANYDMAKICEIVEMIAVNIYAIFMNHYVDPNLFRVVDENEISQHNRAELNDKLNNKNTHVGKVYHIPDGVKNIKF